MIHYPTLATLKNFMMSQGLSTAHFPMLDTPTDVDMEVAEGLDLAYPQASIFRRVLETDLRAGLEFYGSPELILGDRADQVIAFWRDLETLFDDDAGLDKIEAIVQGEPVLPLMPAYSRVGNLATKMFAEHWSIIADSVERTVLDQTGSITLAIVAVRATAEILVADELEKFIFLPLFGINDPGEIDIHDVVEATLNTRHLEYA